MADETTPADDRLATLPPICPYCGSSSVPGGVCSVCRGPGDQATLEATRADLGPWQVRDERRPFLPGCSTARLRVMAARGQVRPETPVRCESGFWAPAGRTVGVAGFLGLCPHCQASVHEASDRCSSCGGAVWSEDSQLSVLERSIARRSTPLLAARVVGVGVMALLLMGAGAAIGRLYELRQHRERDTPPTFPAATLTPEIAALVSEPEAASPSAAVAPDTLPPTPRADAFAEVLEAVARGDFETAARLLADLANNPDLASEAAVWADVVAREQRIAEHHTLP